MGDDIGFAVGGVVPSAGGVGLYVGYQDVGAYVLEEGDVDGWDVRDGQQTVSASFISAQFSSDSSVIIANSITCPHVAPFASGYGMTVDSSTVRPSGQTGQGVSGSSTMGAGVGS